MDMLIETSTDTPAGSIQSNMPPGPLKIKEKSYLTDAPTSDMPTYNVKIYQPRLLRCQYNIHAV